MLLYALTILTSAFLLFQVQPVIAKIILPWFGGSAAVWTTCLLFFQIGLLLGYLYAHAVVRYLKPRTQMFLHVGLLAVSLVALPIYPGNSWKPAGGADPTVSILLLLAATVGLPYFLLSTTGPLLQAWYARRYKGAMPYRLYALSNAGSMFALLSYPVLFEPVFTTHEQATMWSWAYGVFLVLCSVTAVRSGTSFTAALAAEAETDGEKPAARQYVMWLALPACASVLLLAITNHISQNVAAIPFLWVLPLSIYLLTFILCFEGKGWYRRFPYVPLWAVFLGGMVAALFGMDSAPISIVVLLFALGLFTCCMVCHGELVRLKPHPRYLTQFYLMISAGGAMGGLLVGLVAPHLFNAFYEMELGLAACVVLVLFVLRAYPEPDWLENLLSPGRLAAGVAAMVWAGFEGYRLKGSVTHAAWNVAHWVSQKWAASDSFDSNALLIELVLCAVLVLIALRAPRGVKWMLQPRQLGAFAVELAGLMAIGALAYQTTQSTTGYRLKVRNFYGGLKVSDSGTASEFDGTRTLTHGTINHGEEFLNPARRDLPTTYYGPKTGVGVAIRAKQKKGAIRVGVIGLGTGTIAAYGRAGDYYRFYEINPLVPRIARSEFFFLPDCKAKLQVAMGDARLSLEREAPENFDVLAVDAFSSDSIPVHLLTREAMALYFRHLQPDGILAVHISNRYLDLQPVLAGESQALGKVARLVDTEDDETQDVFGATWVLLTAPNPGFTTEELSDSAEIEHKRTVRLWTDDYSNLFQILK